MAATSPPPLVEKVVDSQSSSALAPEQARKKSWFRANHHSRNMLDGASTVEVKRVIVKDFHNKEVVKDSVPLWEDFLTGKFLDAAPHVAKVHVIVNKIWTLGDKSIRIDAFPVKETTIKFRIRDSSVRARILRRGMWNIADIQILVSEWWKRLSQRWSQYRCGLFSKTYHTSCFPNQVLAL